MRSLPTGRSRGEHLHPAVPAARRTILATLALGLIVAALAPSAEAIPAPAGTQAGKAKQVASGEAHKQGSFLCEVAGDAGGLLPVIGGVPGVSKSVCETAGTLAGQAVGSLGNGILDTVARWVIGAATQVTKFVAQEMQQSTTPQLRSAWYEAQFQPMVDLGAALGLLVALIALASAAIRRDPQALAATVAGIVRAGIGTGLVVALTVIGLEIADQISGAVLAGSPHAFWASVANAWGTSGFGGFASSGLAALIAAVELFAAVFVWLELIVRNAAIYIAVLFLPVTLAAAIWPALSAWPGRLGRLLLLFVILKPVALIVLSLAGNAAAAGLSFGGGVSGSVGTILAATVIFGLAAFAPWALMFILAADTETAYLGAGMRTAAGAAVMDSDSPSVRNAGGLRDTGEDSRGGGFPAPPGGAPAGGGLPGGGGFPGGSPRGAPSGGSSSSGGGAEASEGGASTGGSSAAIGDADGGGIAGAESAAPIVAETVALGSVGAAAGMAAAGNARSEGATARRRDEGSGDASSSDGGASPQASPPVAPPAGAPSRDGSAGIPRTAGGDSLGAPPSPPGEDSAGAPGEGRPPGAAAPPAELTPPSPGGASHLQLVREEPSGEDPPPTGPEAA
jgi:hypothetical protein